MTCARCRGRGTYYATLPDSGDREGGYVRCSPCKGTGQVEPEAADELERCPCGCSVPMSDPDYAALHGDGPQAPGRSPHNQKGQP